MSLTEKPLRLSLAAADVFTGMLVMGEIDYCQRIVLADRRFYPPGFPAPPDALFHQAKHRAIVYAQEEFGAAEDSRQIVLAAMKRDHFEHLLPVTVSWGNDLHYPAMKVQWFEQTALPFLDSVTSVPAKSTEPRPANPADSTATSAKPGAATPPVATPAAPASNPDAQHMLHLATLYVKNHQTKLAREKLEAIIRLYPNDPACGPAKELLAQIGKE
jgi:hypothetical protein